MLFMMTKDLSMSLIHFNKTLGKLEVVSTYKIDPSIITGQGRQLTEVTYITYDRASQTLIAVFSSSYVLTLNLSEL